MRPILLLAATWIAAGIAAADLGAQSLATTDTFSLARRTYLANQIAAALPLFAAAVRQAPTDPVRRAWYADAARRSDDRRTGLREAREALRLEPCQAMAHEVLAAIFNPQFSHVEGVDGVNADSTWTHLQDAARCDPHDGHPWLSLWTESMRRGDTTTTRLALRRLVDTRFFAAPWMTHGRWVLSSLPERAIAIAGGDIDTYPAVALQATDGLRADVAFVNHNLLNLPWYVERLRAEHGVPLPPARDTAGLASDRIVAFWRREAASGRLGRPLAILHSAGVEYATSGAGQLVLAGPYWLVAPPGPAIDPALVEASYVIADGLSWEGPIISPTDRSPVRQAYAMHPARMVGYLAGFEAEQLGARFPADRVAWIERFFAKHRLPESESKPVLDWLKGR